MAREIHTVKRRVRILVISYKDVIVLYYSAWRANRYLSFFFAEGTVTFRKIIALRGTWRDASATAREDTDTRFYFASLQ